MAAPPERLAWVVGASGFLGRHAAGRLARAGWRVLGIGRRAPPAGFARAWGMADFVASPLTAAALSEAAARFGAPDLVFHAVGSGSVGAAERDPEGDRAATPGSLEAVIETLRRRAPAARLLYPSSAAVYGAAGPHPIAEDAPTAPVSHYGRNKLRAEALCEAAGRGGLAVAIIRFFSVYGPEQKKLLFWEIAQRLLAGADAVELGGSGDEIRDFLFIEDAADLLALLAETARPGCLAVNGGTGRGTRVREAALALAAALGRAPAFRFSGEARPGDPPYLIADTRRAAGLGFVPRTDLAAGLARTAEWLCAAAGRER